jgi:hypothetical protein
MTRMKADPGALAAAARALQEATAVADEVHRGARSLADAAAATGSASLQDALGTFRHTWAYGLGLVIDDATTLAHMLGQAATAYEHAEAAIGRACGP